MKKGRSYYMKALSILAILMSTCLHSLQAAQVNESIYSKILKENRSLLISLPDSYKDGDMQQEKYPIIYLLDGNENFESVDAMKNYLIRKRFSYLPEAIIVGIANTNRTRDLTPPLTSQEAQGRTQDYSAGGGLPNFVNFLEGELIPAMEARYRVSDYRILIGHSFGGLAATHILMEHTSLFHAYVIIDPSLWWDNKAILPKLQQFLQTKKAQDRNIYLALANNIVYATRETVQVAHAEAIRYTGEQLLPLSQIPKNRWHFKFYADDEHGTVSIPATYDALKFLFKEVDLPMKDIIKDPSVLTRCYTNLSNQLAADFQPSIKMYADLAQFAYDRKEFINAKILLNMALTKYPKSQRLKQLQDTFK